MTYHCTHRDRRGTEGYRVRCDGDETWAREFIQAIERMDRVKAWRADREGRA